MSYGEGAGTDFATMRGRNYPSIRQFTVFLENRVGQLLEVVRRFENSKVKIVALSIVDSAECSFVRFLLSHPEQGREILERAGLAIVESDLIGLELPDGPNPLLDVCTALLQAEVNIVQAYPLMKGAAEFYSDWLIQLDDGTWVVEIRPRTDAAGPMADTNSGDVIALPDGVRLHVDRAHPTGQTRLWRSRIGVEGPIVAYLARNGRPIRYSYVPRGYPLSQYQTVFAREPGSAEMPSASRPFSPSVVTRLVSAGVLIAPLTLHCGVSSLEGDEDPYPEPYDVPPATAELVNHVRARGNRVIAGGTTVVRALETAALAGSGSGGPGGLVTAGAGWTSHVVTPETGVRAVDGLLTGLHEPRSSHLRMLAAFAGPSLLSRCYQAAVDAGYLWHEFGDVHLLLP
jgi:S-adenosylmethionine:tRNA ribosyltransferase-isomerase